MKLEIHAASKQNYDLHFSPGLGIDPQIDRVILNGKLVAYKLLTNRFDSHCQIECKIIETTVIEIMYQPGIQIELPESNPQMGATSRELKLIDYSFENSTLTLIVEGLAGNSYSVKIRTRYDIKSVKNAAISADSGMEKEVAIQFASGEEKRYQRKAVTLKF